MAETPSDYDLIQDDRIDELESLITAEYEPPSGVEYSFPVANQGITQEQFRLMNLGQANGMIHGDNGVVNDNPNSTGWRYYLDRHDSDSETNQRNTLILRAGTSAESIVEGFYHRLTEDMELPFPAVTSTTIYHVTITYDPRDFKTSPVKIQVYPGEPPTSQGRVHLLLYKVERKPNQLLSQAEITRYRPYTAGVLSVQNKDQLPDPAQYPAGTLVVPSREGGGLYVRQNGGLVWLDALKNLKPGPWENGNILTSHGWSGTAKWRHRQGGIDYVANLRGGNYEALCQLPEGYELDQNWYGTCFTSSGPRGLRIQDNSRTFRIQSEGTPGYIRFSVFIPDFFY